MDARLRGHDGLQKSATLSVAAWISDSRAARLRATRTLHSNVIPAQAGIHATG
jgi:hypothetical protein